MWTILIVVTMDFEISQMNFMVGLVALMAYMAYMQRYFDWCDKSWWYGYFSLNQWWYMYGGMSSNISCELLRMVSWELFEISIMKRTIISCCKEVYNDAYKFDTGNMGIQNSETNSLYNFWATITVTQV